MIMPYWIQHADFSSEDYDSVASALAVEIFQKHDWASELKAQKELEASGEDNCDPGIGFTPDDGRILHVCPRSDHSARVYYKFVREGSILGLIPTRRELNREGEVAISEIPDFIRRFFDSDHDWLIDQTL